MKKGYFSGFILLLFLLLYPIRVDAISCGSGCFMVEESTNISLSNTYIDNDVYIKRNAYLVVDGDVTVDGNVYVLGTLKNTGNLTVTGTVYCLDFNGIMSAGSYGYGYFISTGKVNINGLNVRSDFLYDGTLDITHNWGDWEIDIPEYCDSGSTSIRTCQDCGKQELRDNPKEYPYREHEFGDWYVVKEATCVSEGTRVRNCLYCEYKEGEVIPKTNIHQYGDWYVSREPACTEVGLEQRTCTQCGHSEPRGIPPKGHSYGDWYTYVTATCTSDGSMGRNCSRCGQIETRTIPATGHQLGEWVRTYEPTYEYNGEEERYCTNCGILLETRNIPKLQRPTSEPSTETPSTPTPAPTPSEPVGPSVLALNTSRIVMQVGKSFSGVKADYITKGDKIVRWKSSKPSVVSVNRRGKLTAKKVGSARITAYTNRGAEGAFTVRVQKKKVSLSSINVKKRYVTLKLKNGKKTYQIQAAKTPMTYSGRITYKSVNRKIATVNSKGKITAKKAGKTKIYVKCGKKTVTVRVTVKKR